MKHLILACCLALLAGCGGPGGAAVSGKVTYTDGSPLPKGVVVYTGKGGSYQSAIASDGTYTLENVAEGSYQVVITGAFEGDAQVPEMQYDADGNYIETPAPQRTPLISDRYTNPDESGLSVTVPGNYDLQVEKL